MSFSGFPTDTLDFLADLEVHNDKAWFDRNRDRYEAAYLEPAKDFVDALGEVLQRDISAGIRAEPKVNSSIRRINRDVRFSKDKSPYKDHLDLMFPEGEGKAQESPGFYFRLSADEVLLAAGMRGFEKGALERYRAAVLDDATGIELEKAIAKVRRAGADYGEPRWKRVPRGLDASHSRADLLRYDGAITFLEADVPKAIGSARFVDWVARRMVKLSPVERWVMDNVWAT